MNMIRTVKYLLILISLVVTASCVPQQAGTQFNTYTVIDQKDAVCDPFGKDDDVVVDSSNGILAKLYSAGGNVGQKVSDYMKPSMLVSESLIFSKIYVPTRNFQDGFVNGGGDFLIDKAGQKLIEYFAVSFEGRIKLDPRLDEEGVYEFAILSDDGSVLKLDQGQGLMENVNNDGVTSTRMGCASSVVNLSYQSDLSFMLNYLQAPKTEIAVVLMFRKVAEDMIDFQNMNFQKSKFCGQSKGYGFFQDNGPDDKLIHQDLRNEGFKPLAASNFLLPKSIQKNPCFK